MLAGFIIPLAAIPLIAGGVRFFRIIGAANSPIKSEIDVVDVNVGTWRRRVQARQGPSTPYLEWRLLPFQQRVSGTIRIGGRVESDRWLVIQLSDKKFIWPGARAQPVIGTGTLDIPQEDWSNSPVIAAHHRLLAAYVLLIRYIDHLPFIVRHQPGEPTEAPWWLIGAPRAIVKGLAAAHIRRRLRILGDALTRAAVLTRTDDNRRDRSTLNDASAECQALAGTLRRSSWRGVIAFLITTALPVGITIYTAFVQAPPIHLNLAGLEILSFLCAIGFILISPFIFTRSIRCKRVYSARPPELEGLPFS